MVSPVKVDEVYRMAEGQRQVFNNGDVRLSSHRRGRRDCDVEVTVVVRAIFGHRSEEYGQDYGGIAGHHGLDRSIEIMGMGRILSFHTFEVS